MKRLAVQGTHCQVGHCRHGFLQLSKRENYKHGTTLHFNYRNTARFALVFLPFGLVHRSVGQPIFSVFFPLCQLLFSALFSKCAHSFSLDETNSVSWKLYFYTANLLSQISSYGNLIAAWITLRGSACHTKVQGLHPESCLDNKCTLGESKEKLMILVKYKFTFSVVNILKFFPSLNITFINAEVTVNRYCWLAENKWSSQWKGSWARVVGERTKHNSVNKSQPNKPTVQKRDNNIFWHEESKLHRGTKHW